MINVLINAYAVSPNWGSEPGMGWNWVTNIAKYCNVHVITEGEWRSEIEVALADLPQRNNIHFYYNPVPEKIRKMSRNQGDWRFYWYYRKWQKKTLCIAQDIILNNRIDIIHQLNMIGFREPGYLWKIKNIPLIWGPVGGMELMPLSYLEGAPMEQRVFNKLKNMINVAQYSFFPRVKRALKSSDVIISAVKGVQDVLKEKYGITSILINETGADIVDEIINKQNGETELLKIIWIGKFDFRKQLPLALRTIAAVNQKDIELHICGTGNVNDVKFVKELAVKLGIQKQCHWYGNVDHGKIYGLMATSDLLFFTSIMEATSTVVLEAISVGLPVLCHNLSGFGPLIREFGGWTIEASTPEKSVLDFANIIEFLHNNPEEIRKKSQECLRHRKELSWESKAKKVVSIYQEVISKKQN